MYLSKTELIWGRGDKIMAAPKSLKTMQVDETVYTIASLDAWEAAITY